MKKKHVFWLIFVIVLAILILVLLVLDAVGVSALGMFVEKPNLDEIDLEQLRQIKQSYLDTKTGYPDYITVDSVYVEEYCGSYDGCLVMLFSDSEAVYAQAIRIVSIAGIRIRYNDANELYAWKNGKLYTLEQAYVAGILNKSDIRKIRDIHNQY